jgi:hypothetical protein
MESIFWTPDGCCIINWSREPGFRVLNGTSIEMRDIVMRDAGHAVPAAGG